MRSADELAEFLRRGQAAQEAVTAIINAGGHRNSEARQVIDAAIYMAIAVEARTALRNAAEEVRTRIREALFHPEIRRHVQNYAAELDAEARGKSYVILDSPESSGGHAILCLRCRMTSHHPGDVEHLWCARCNAEHER